MARILWIGDAGTPTGFGRVAEEIGGRLVTQYGHEIHALAVLWGAADPYTGPLQLYRANAGEARHPLGYDRVVELIDRLEPDLVVTLEDAPQLRKRLLGNRFDTEGKLAQKQPVLSYLPIDGYGIPPEWLDVKRYANVVAMSQFGAEMMGVEHFVYHGVDTNVFHPVDDDHPIESIVAGPLYSKAGCREAFNIPQDAFVIGRVDTNSGRKDYGSTWRVIDTAYRMGLVEGKTVAVFHTKINAPQHGVNIEALISRGGGKYMVTNDDNWPIPDVVALMNCFDLFLTTSRGEGFGLTIAEAMACGVPILATSGSAITEVVGPGGVLVEGISFLTNPYGVDLILTNANDMAGQLVLLARNPERRKELAEAGLAHVRENFSWDQAAARFHFYIEALTKPQEREEGIPAEA